MTMRSAVEIHGESDLIEPIDERIHHVTRQGA